MRERGIPVVQVVTRLNVGGTTRQLHLLHDGLPARGYETFVLAGRESGREGRISIEGPNALVLPELARETRPFDDARALRSIASQLRRRGPAIVHTHLAKAGALGRVAARWAGVPVVIHTYHGHVLRGYFSRPVARSFLEIERRLARRSDALVAVSPQVRDDLLELGVGTERQWRVIRVGVDVASFGRPRRGPARVRLGLPAEAPLVGVVGRIVSIKDLETFVRAAARLAGAHPEVRFVVAGDGDDRRSLEPTARSALGERVTFLGWVNDLPALYAALDVVVLTSRNEGTPVSLIEAGAASRPVVATRVGGVPDVVEDGRTGWLVGVGDDAAVASRVARLLEPATARTFGRAGRARIAERFSADAMLDAYAGLYDALLEPAGVRHRAVGT
ncbi:MAG: glycosyltransferase family 4 protein [Actinomycetota bacterium]